MKHMVIRAFLGHNKKIFLLDNLSQQGRISLKAEKAAD